MPDLPSLVDLLTLDRISVSISASTKSEVIEHCAAHLVTADVVLDAEQLVADLHAREAQLSTGVGDGMALPHARTTAVSGTVAALATMANPVDWDAIDERPVDLVLLFAGPKGDRGAHVRLLAQISRVLSAPSVREQLSGAESSEDILDALQAVE